MFPKGDFVVAASADPRQIKLAFDGAEKMEIDAEGNLVLRIDGGEVLLHKPLVYQHADGHRRPIVGSFVLEGAHEAGFCIGAYDPTKALIIDPVLSYSTYLGGSFEDYASAIAVDSEGNAYVTGYTFSTNFPTLNPLPLPNSGFSRAFVTKFNAAGQLVYSTHLGGFPDDIWETVGRGIAVDAVGNAYVTGQTSATNFPTVNAFQPTRSTLSLMQKASAQGARRYQIQ